MVLSWLHYEELCNLCWSSKGTPEACIALVLSIAVAFRIVGGSDISCLDFGRKMRGMNCRCSEVISRATGILQACVSRLQALRYNGVPPSRAGFHQRPTTAPGRQGHISPAPDHLS